MRHVHWWTRKRIQRLFGAGLRAGSHRRLLDELSRCPVCAQEYRRYQLLEAILCGNDGPTPFAIDRIESLALDAAGESPPREKPNVWAVGTFLAAAVAAAILFPRTWASPPEHGGGVSVSSVENARLRGGAPKQSDVGIRLYRATADDAVEETATLELDDVITFSYTNVRPEIRYLTLIGIQDAITERDRPLTLTGARLPLTETPASELMPEGRAIRWYYPDRDAAGSMAIQSDKVDEPLGDGFKLRVRHTCGWLRVVAIFSGRPMDVADIEAAVRMSSPEFETGEVLGAFTSSNSDVIEHSILANIVCAR